MEVKCYSPVTRGFHPNFDSSADIHTRNLAIEIPGLNPLDEKTFLEKLGKPEIGAVTSRDGQPLPDNLLSHIIRPATFAHNRILSSSPFIKIIDFGGAFSNKKPPKTLYTPLPVRPPEVVFGDVLDERVELWSAGCLVDVLYCRQQLMMTLSLTVML